MVLKWSFLLWLVFVTFIIALIPNAESLEYLNHEQISEIGRFNTLPDHEYVGNEYVISSKDRNFKEKEIIKLVGTADIYTMRNGALQLKSNLNLTTVKQFECPTLDAADNLTQEQLINRLTAPCRYDRFQSPVSYSRNKLPVNVYVRTLIYKIQNSAASSIHFQIHGLMQLRYNDPRLAYGNFVTYQKKQIISEVNLENKIWVPKIYVANQHGSSELWLKEKIKFASLSSDGSVIISVDIEATNNCWVDKNTFPFDEKVCSNIIKSYKYNSSQLLLYWERKSPILYDPEIILSQYVLTNTWTNKSFIIANIDDMEYGLSPGNYSSLSFTLHLTREVDLFIMDYFIPSMMIVAISWVSFWLQADQTPARTTLGTSTMLSFITLTSSRGKNMPEINNIDISEIWFLGCTVFIFGSLVEFAFVNNVWRRSKSVELKKINSKHIIKSSFISNSKSQNFGQRRSSVYKRKYKNALRLENPTAIYMNEEVKNKNDIESKDINNQSGNSSFSKMTPHEVSLWIDRKARFIFPLGFILFNGIFWSFLYCL